MLERFYHPTTLKPIGAKPWLCNRRIDFSQFGNAASPTPLRDGDLIFALHYERANIMLSEVGCTGLSVGDR